MAGQGRVESTPGKGSRALTIVVHVRSPIPMFPIDMSAIAGTPPGRSRKPW